MDGVARVGDGPVAWGWKVRRGVAPTADADAPLPGAGTGMGMEAGATGTARGCPNADCAREGWAACTGRCRGEALTLTAWGTGMGTWALASTREEEEEEGVARACWVCEAAATLWLVLLLAVVGAPVFPLNVASRPRRGSRAGTGRGWRVLALAA